MTKVANAYYSSAVEHSGISGLFHATFGIPGHPPQWVNGPDGKPKLFRARDEAILSGFKVMVARLNRARQEQDFLVKKGGSPRSDVVKGGTHKNRITSWSSPPEKGPTVESVFGKNGR